MAMRQDPGNPGVMLSDDGQRYKIVDAQPRVLVDTALVTTGLQTANAEYLWFQNTANKKAQHSNFGNARRIPAGRFFELHRVGIYVAPVVDGNTEVTAADMKKAIHTAAFEFFVNSIEVAKGPIRHYPSGYGSSGLDGDVGVLNNGVPSQAAQTGLVEPLIITDQVDLTGKVQFFDATWNANSQLPNFGSRLEICIELTGILFTAATI
ncbi:MAG: hypothetical protein WC700_17510 [Gemmatimonadaceae bacterium]|jgi:hypothetical protein